jgi:YebC/PmpR family DNA-binding regulatory protein
MSGHSKWAQIKRQKGVTDARRGQLFTKLGREIAVAARQGGGDPEANPRLRLAVDRARSFNMPNDTIERAIKRATGESGATELSETIYEGYGPGGAAIMIEVLTDNRNRAVSDVRHALAKAGGNLGEAGCVAWIFESKGVIGIRMQGDAAEEVALQAIDAGAEDVKIDDDGLEIHIGPQDLESVRRALEEGGVEIASAEVSRVPKSTVPLDERQAEQTLRLLDRLDELDDVQRVYSNGDFPDEVLAAYSR